jgi:hypothetical protein
VEILKNSHKGQLPWYLRTTKYTHHRRANLLDQSNEKSDFTTGGIAMSGHRNLSLVFRAPQEGFPGYFTDVALYT